MAAQARAVERIDPEPRRLSGPDMRGLRFLEVRHHPHPPRHQLHQLGAGGHVLAQAHADLAELAVLRRVDAGIGQVDLGQSQRRAGVGDRGGQRVAVDDHRTHVLVGRTPRGLSLAETGLGLAQGRQGLVAFAQRQRAVADQGAGAAHVGLGAGEVGPGGAQLRLDVGHRRLAHPLRLGRVGQVGLLRGEIGAGLLDPLAVVAVVQLDQHLPGPDPLVVLHPHLGDVAVDLRRDHGDAAAHVGVLGGLARARKRPQAPGVQDQQHADDGDQDGRKGGFGFEGRLQGHGASFGISRGRGPLAGIGAQRPSSARRGGRVRGLRYRPWPWPWPWPRPAVRTGRAPARRS